jgi:glycosyltransferase involved in cell wall biosynthesis
MRILHLATFLQDVAGRVIVDLATDQRHQGDDVAIVVSSSGPPGYGNHAAYLDALGRNGVPVHLVDSMVARDFASNLCVLGALDALYPAGREPNVIHTHAAIPSLVALLYAGVRRRPMTLLQTMHGWELDKTPDQTATDIALLNRVDRVAVPSQHAHDLLRSLGVLAEQLTIVPYGVDDRQGDLEPADEAVMHAMIRARRRGALVLCCVGTMATGRNQWPLIEAIARLVGKLAIHCIFIGDFDTAELRAAARHAGVESSVQIHGDSRAARRLAAGADALVLPSRSESQPLAVLEAFCDGTLVATSDIPELLELVTDGETGLTFALDDAEALAAALVRLSTLPNQVRREIRKRARSLYVEKFSTTMMTKQYATLYERLQHVPVRTPTRPRPRVA